MKYNPTQTMAGASGNDYLLVRTVFLCIDAVKIVTRLVKVIGSKSPPRLATFGTRICKTSGPKAFFGHV